MDAGTSARSRLRDLIRVNHDLVADLDLATVLRRIVEAGVEVVDARYGALGVVGTGNRLERFIHVGMDDATVDGISHLPQGEGLLGALIDDPRPVRLDVIADHPRSIGFPSGHPPMSSFIGVPIRVRGDVFGNLYLTDSRRGAFSADDEELAHSLAATAGVAIENARLFEDAEYRARWSTALVDVSRTLIGQDDGQELDLLLGRLRELTYADLVSVSLVDDDLQTIVVERAAGAGSDALVSVAFPIASSIVAGPLRTGEPLLVHDLSEHPDDRVELLSRLGSGMLIPFTSPTGTAGLVCVARTKERLPFADRDVDMGLSFAGHVAVALDRSQSRAARRRVALLEDRARIARDLHDHVIQRLFATGLNLQVLAGLLDGPHGERVMDQIAEIDGAIGQIRRSIFEMRRPSDATTVGLRLRIEEVAARARSQLTEPPGLHYHGPVDLISDAALLDDMTAVVTEAISNAVRHGRSDRVRVTISADEGQVRIEVVDDGVGLAGDETLSGLENLAQRAAAWGGTLELRTPEAGGTTVVWTARVGTLGRQ